MKIKLPPLPEPWADAPGGWAFTADQMRSYAAAALAAAAAEPVAYLHEWKPHAGVIGKSLHWRRVSPHGDDMQVTPLYAAPPQREPLTDEQVQAICKKARDDAEAGWPYGPHYVSLVIRGVEQAHGITKEKS